jgi:hypothetical protein
MSVQAQGETSPVHGFAEAIAAQEFDSLARYFHPKVRFRALTPNSTFGHVGSESAIATVKNWFGDASEIRLVSSEIEPVSNRVRLAYRFRVFEDNAWNVVEQQAYCTVSDGLVTDISIVCSGFCPID